MLRDTRPALMVQPSRLAMTTLHETQDATGLRAAYFSLSGDPPAPFSVMLSPLVDGGWHASLTDGSDFKVMERGICVNIAVPAHCNTLNEWGY